MAKKAVIRKPVNKTKAKAKSNKPESADPPEEVKTPQWKKKARKDGRKPRRLVTMEETWGNNKKRDSEPRRKGLKILVYGEAKVGKSRIGQTAVDFNGFTGDKREIPSGYPVYILDSEEDSALDTAEQDFWNELQDGKILIEPASVINPNTNKLNHLKSMKKVEQFSHAVLSQTQGTLVVDTITDYDGWLYYVLNDVVLGKDYGFNEIGVERKKPTPVEWRWKRRQYVEFIRDLRRTEMNVIIIAQSKEEYTGEGFDAKPTGALLPDTDKKTAHWVDMVILLTKEEDEIGEFRQLEVVKSRFEDEKIENIILRDDKITFSDLIDAISEKL